MRPQIIGSLALLGRVSLAAANDVVSLMLPMVDQQDLVAEVIGSDGPMTTYVIGCPEGADSNDCGLGDGLTVTAGHSTFIYEYSFDDYWLRESCKYRGTTWVSCEVTNTQSDFSSAMAITTSVDVPYVAVTVTSTATDAERTATATATSTSAEPKSESSSSTPSESASTTAQPSGSASPTTDSSADAEETSSDNAAMAQVTGSATQWLVSGAGMALALALA
ncbi:hypothetical protein ASPVEDRAFT_79508 [Aspergillus versicolor CBS 583.65]|uniref:Uncharacterized protein n=1 Tax=Aspergillus versicolor CBS 583.65 TaxID=1036611 RepID=A0A1L9P8F5_ASPVE|nr:uncharacterized protein ASPVEDRAFT_79508 [Aspergillus versicolor CBS 583.65]OJI97820.1 hypothetical protein ASPVEDRAFT_79508 [Aspergillus versicolor CBS 583.65]